MISDLNLVKLVDQKCLKISKQQLDYLKESAKLIKQVDTFFSGDIRIYNYNNYYIFQEQTPRDEILIRKFDKKNEALKLLDVRLKIYEKMWNGCGCKINYYK